MPALLDHRRLLRLSGSEHVVLAAEHFRPLEIPVDFQPQFPSERDGSRAVTHAELLLSTRLADAEQLPEAGELAVPVFTLEGGGHGGRDRRAREAGPIAGWCPALIKLEADSTTAPVTVDRMQPLPSGGTRVASENAWHAPSGPARSASASSASLLRSTPPSGTSFSDAPQEGQIAHPLPTSRGTGW